MSSVPLSTHDSITPKAKFTMDKQELPINSRDSVVQNLSANNSTEAEPTVNKHPKNRANGAIRLDKPQSRLVLGLGRLPGYIK